MNKSVLFVTAVLMCGQLLAQKVSGTVMDSNGPIPGANVVIKGTSNGTATDFDGQYSIEVLNPNAILVFSSIGYVRQEIPFNGQNTIDVVMVDDLQSLDEVVIVGYSSRKKSNLTGAVSTVNVGEIEKTRVATVSQALQGQIAGVQIASNSGAPGDDVQVRIRGVGTIGNNNPLYVIDGIPTREISFLNQADIESISVLKDAAAAAIYGSRASGGVVLITTKGGNKGKLSINADYYYGVNQVTNLPQLLNTQQYLDVLETAWNNTFDATPENPNIYTLEKQRTDLADTDWLDELFKNGAQQNLQLTASGGNEKVQFLMSLGYFNQEGTVVYENDGFQRLNYRTNINADLSDRFKIGTNLQLSHSKLEAVPSTGESLIRFALLRAPVIPVFKDPSDPTYSTRDPFTDLPFYDPDNFNLDATKSLYELVGNPVAQAFFTDDVEQVYRTFGNVFGEYAFLKDKSLKLRTNVGLDLAFSRRKIFNENYGDDDGGGNEIDAGLGRRNRPNNLDESRGESFSLTLNTTLNYTKNFNEIHDFSALIGTEYISNTASSIGGARRRFPFTDDEFRFLDFGSPDLDVTNGGSASESTLLSYFASTSYAYDGKYLITANIRADASSRFGENNRWGYFPSVSAGWNLAEESFMKDVDWLSNLKLRGSWGVLGNQEIDDFTFLTLISQNDGIIQVDRFGNPDLKWESSEQINFGLDLGLFRNKLAVTLEYFDKNTSDILLPISLPSVVGNVQPTIVNSGEVRNKGFEFSLNYANAEGAFKYNINANFATLTNNVERLNPNLPNIPGEVTRTQAGQPLNAYYGFQVEGIYQDQSEIDAHLSPQGAAGIKPGDIRFVDINGDGIISADNDRTFIGSPIPDLTYGLSFSSSYKGFDFSFLFQGVEGVDRFNDGKRILDFDTRPFNFTTGVLGAWNGSGTSNSLPRVAFEDTGISRVSSLFVEDASYLRLKNIELGYTLPQLSNLPEIRFYLSGQNLLTVTDYTGLDPESVDLTDNGTFPSSKSYIFGMNVSF
ncbi:MAG: TonB-dependent receptor [Bacteroidota bacterium]